MTPVDDETAARIQEFVSWASAKGYHVVGALMSPKLKPQVRVFASTPEGSLHEQEQHLRKMVEALYYTVQKGKGGDVTSLNLGLN